MTSYIRTFVNTKTGERVRGELQGNGGVAVPLVAIETEIRRAQDGLPSQGRFYEPMPGHVKIHRVGCDAKAYDDPSAFTVMPLVHLKVESNRFANQGETVHGTVPSYATESASCRNEDADV